MSSITTSNNDNSDDCSDRSNSSGIIRSKFCSFKCSKFCSFKRCKFECIKRGIFNRIDFGGICITATNFVLISIFIPVIVIFWLFIVFQLKFREQKLKRRNKVRIQERN